VKTVREQNNPLCAQLPSLVKLAAAIQVKTEYHLSNNYRSALASAPGSRLETGAVLHAGDALMGARLHSRRREALRANRRLDVDSGGAPFAGEVFSGQTDLYFH
jgi:hypothetical protein